MQTAVAVRLRLADVIRHANQMHVVLADQQVRNGVHVLHIRADNADAGNILQVFDGAVDADFVVLAL